MAFGSSADENSLALAKEILLQAPGNPEAKAVLNDLAGRKKRKKFGVPPELKPPADLEDWIRKQSTARLIASLEDVCAQQDGWPGGVDLASDWRVQALIRIGDPAVPALINVIEKDVRLTRSVHAWRPNTGCTILAVREAALTAVMSILRVQVFEAGFTGDNFTSRGSKAAKEAADQLRRYWVRYGKFPFDERMMHVLRDPAVTGPHLLDAARSLAWFDHTVRLGTTVWTNESTSPEKPRENPVLAKFSDPTAAEAIFAAMKRELALHDAVRKKEPKDESLDWKRERLESEYARALGALGDKRIAGALVNYAATLDRRQRLSVSLAADKLGDSAGFASICREVTRGDWDIPSLSRLLDAMLTSSLPEATAALKSIEKPGHPLYHEVLDAAEVLAGEYGDRPYWLITPFAITVLRNSLEDTSPSGWKYHRKDGQMWFSTADEQRGQTTTLPEYVKEPEWRFEELAETKADRAARVLGKLVWTFPQVHPLAADNKERMETLRVAISRYRYRPETREEHDVRQAGEAFATVWGILPDIPPLPNAATPEDVAAGRAVFTRNGESTRLPMKLPARAVFAEDAGEDQKQRTAIIVQAEMGKDGRVMYGVLFRGGMGIMTDKELSGIMPMEKQDPAE